MLGDPYRHYGYVYTRLRLSKTPVPKVAPLKPPTAQSLTRFACLPPFHQAKNLPDEMAGLLQSVMTLNCFRPISRTTFAAVSSVLKSLILPLDVCGAPVAVRRFSPVLRPAACALRLRVIRARGGLVPAGGARFAVRAAQVVAHSKPDERS